MAFDVVALRKQFPSLRSGIAHFDAPGGTQTPRPVVDAIAATLSGPLSNRGHGVESEANAEHAIAAFRDAFADFLGAEPMPSSTGEARPSSSTTSRARSRSSGDPATRW